MGTNTQPKTAKKTIHWLKKTIAIILLVLFVIAYVLYRSRFAIHEKPITLPPVSVSTYVVKTAPMFISTETNGQVHAINAVQIHAKVAGYITKILVHEGDTVTQGQPLVLLDHKADQDDLAQKKAALDLSKSNYQRALHITSSGAISKQQLAKLKSTYLSDLATYHQSAANLNDKIINAPINGVVGNINLTVGDYIDTSKVLFSITDLSKLEVQYSLAAKFYQATHLQLPIEIKSLINAKQKALGHISFISPTVHHLTQTFNIHATFNNNDHYFNPGESVLVKQNISKNNNGISIPLEAVMTSLAGNSVYVIHHSHAVKQPIVIGLANKNNIAVLKGLKAGDRIILSTSQVRDGSKVSWQ